MRVNTFSRNKTILPCVALGNTCIYGKKNIHMTYKLGPSIFWVRDINDKTYTTISTVINKKNISMHPLPNVPNGQIRAHFLMQSAKSSVRLVLVDGQTTLSLFRSTGQFAGVGVRVVTW